LLPATTPARQSAALPAHTAAAPLIAGTPPKQLINYYAFLGIAANADAATIRAAYEAATDTDDLARIARAERALAVLRDPQKWRAYDQALTENEAAVAADAQFGSRPAPALRSQPRSNGDLVAAGSAGLRPSLT